MTDRTPEESLSADVVKSLGLVFGDIGTSPIDTLSEVILCATGGEALYADMGQLGRKPILRAWYFVFGALLLNYLGQGAYLNRHPDAQNVLFEMIFQQAQVLYVPFLILSIFIDETDQPHIHSISQTPGPQTASRCHAG